MSLTVHDPDALRAALQPDRPHQVVIIQTEPKSMGLAVALAFFFGPLGLLYSAPTGAIILFLLAFPVGFITLGLGLFCIWVAGIVWAVVAVGQQNDRLAAQQRAALK